MGAPEDIVLPPAVVEVVRVGTPAEVVILPSAAAEVIQLLGTDELAVI